MAQTPPNKAAAPDPSDPLFTLKHAQAEADLEAKNGLGPTTNEYVSTDEDDEISDAEGPRDSQGQRRGENDDVTKGDSAGSH
ncbi:hypothetical protein [Hymenobacter sp. PAMC 26628]|uniref:hypothetical protein n=1 Tax=Hymenobacter sp. PAMC 26628 TaxID=1484118 RepID=UPI000770412E|nr:hypothetical protein [Hymenobacter sp. PAMC 26628]AMJ66770.1 hypothetical protein AXW84_16065 [Hymenobacter sp. PAMC 26628]